MKTKKNKEKQSRKYTVMFPFCKNIHLTKRVGMIPYIMGKITNYDGEIICYQNEDVYPYLKTDTPGLSLHFMKKTTGFVSIDGLLFLLKEAYNIKILQLLHFTSFYNFLWIFLYKLINPRGKVYLMLDFDDTILQYNFSGLWGVFKHSMLKKCDLISIETEELSVRLSQKWNVEVSYIPNGCYVAPSKKIVTFTEKDNIICTVGRIGTYQKNTEMLLKAFVEFSRNNPDWILKVIGSVEPSFLSYINTYYAEHPELKDRVIFTGNIINKKLLFDEYRKAKIFVLTSRYEGYANVYMEAMRGGCYIITSAVYCAQDVLKNNTYGVTVPIDDWQALSEVLLKISQDETLLKQNCPVCQQYVQEKYDWNIICHKILGLLNEEKLNEVF